MFERKGFREWGDSPNILYAVAGVILSRRGCGYQRAAIPAKERVWETGFVSCEIDD